MEALRRHRTRLFNVFNKELDDFNQALEEELALRDRTFASEPIQFQDEKDALQQRLDKAEGFVKRCQNLGLNDIEDLENVRTRQQLVSRIEDLEREVLELRACPKSENLGPDSETINAEEHQQVKQRLAELERDYAKLAVARNALEARCRYFKNLTKDWRAYARASKFSHGTKLETGDSVKNILDNTSANNGERNTFPGEPAPTSFSGEALSRSRSPSASSRPTSPQIKAAMGLTTPATACSPRVGQSPKEMGVAVKIEAFAQDTKPLPISARNSETTDTSDDSEKQVEARSRVKDQENSTPQETEGSMRVVEDDSDCPVVVSERSLKRKRAPSIIKNSSTVQYPGSMIPGSAAKPLCVKSEPGSSSPAVPDIGIGPGVTTDSLDLDDVGDRLLTPRKRRRLELRRMRSSMLKASAATENGEVLLDYGLNDADSEFDNDDLDHRSEGEYEQNAEGTYLRDREYYIRKGEEYGMRLWEEEQLKSAELRKQAELDAKVPEWLRGGENRIRAQQFLQNQRTGNRRARLEFDQQMKPTRIDPDLIAHQAPRFRFPTTVQDLPVQERNDRLVSSSTSELSGGREPRHGRPAVLQSKDPNQRLLPRTSEQQKRARPSRRNHSPTAIAAMAEDGENLDSGRNAPRNSKNSNTGEIDTSRANFTTPKAPDAFHRLGDLLAKPSPENPHLLLEAVGSRLAKPSRTSRTTPARHPGTNDIGTPINQRPTSARSIRLHAPLSNLPRSASNKSPILAPQPPDPPSPSHEPLRARPLHRLCAEDFKPNPTYNQGHSFAFSEVVRSRDARQCLPGCDKPQCCGGQLRKIVQIGGLPAPNRGSLPAQSSTTNEDDQRILFSYLGGPSAHPRLECMPEAEKAEMLLKAKTKLFADEYGKHRQAYGRAPTPPGFWRTDMPTTQEEEEDRRLAGGLERARVGEMWRESMREGGAWMFRDE